MRAATLAAARAAAYRLAAASGWPARRRRAGATIYGLHNVVADGTPLDGSDHSLHIEASAFQDYVALIADAHDVVPLSELAARVSRGQPVHGLAALTFDDAYAGVFARALPILRARALPATVFVVAGAPDAPAGFWWDLLARGGEVPPDERRACLERDRGDRDAVLARHPAAARRALSPELLPAPWETIARWSGPLVEYGSHTVSHRNLAALAPDEQRAELVASRRRLAERLGPAPALASYPYGLLAPDTLRIAREAGYAGGVTMRFGLAGARRAAADALALPRVNVPAGIALDALECWGAGIRLRRGA
jgi:peptidoglycan/xylan/chitin deacetylase (PgdA/CDA1 family)